MAHLPSCVLFSIILSPLATSRLQEVPERGLSRIWGLLGRFPFVTTGRPDKFDSKWNARVLRTERTSLGHEIGPLSTFGHAQNARIVRPDIWRQVSLFARAQTVTAICFLYFNGRRAKCLCLLGANKLISSSNVVYVNHWEMAPEVISVIARKRQSKVVHYFC